MTATKKEPIDSDVPSERLEILRRVHDLTIPLRQNHDASESLFTFELFTRPPRLALYITVVVRGKIPRKNDMYSGKISPYKACKQC